MALPDAQPRAAPSSGWLGVVLGGIVVLGLVVAGILYAARKGEEQRVLTAQEKQEQLDQFKGILRQRIGTDITSAGKNAGFCPTGCDSSLFSGDAVQSWQFRTPDAVLLVSLHGDWDTIKPNPPKPRYILRFRWSSTREDGDLAPVAPRLQQLLDSLLKRFNYPPEFLFPTPRPYAERGNSIYNAMADIYRPAIAYARPYHHNGAEKLRGERMATITRTGPFTEDGSWYRER